MPRYSQRPVSPRSLDPSWLKSHHLTSPVPLHPLVASSTPLAAARLPLEQPTKTACAPNFAFDNQLLTFRRNLTALTHHPQFSFPLPGTTDLIGHSGRSVDTACRSRSLPESRVSAGLHHCTLVRSKTLPASVFKPAPPPKDPNEKNTCQGPFCYSPKASGFDYNSQSITSSAVRFPHLSLSRRGRIARPNRFSSGSPAISISRPQTVHSTVACANITKVFSIRRRTVLGIAHGGQELQSTSSVISLPPNSPFRNPRKAPTPPKGAIFYSELHQCEPSNKLTLPSQAIQRHSAINTISDNDAVFVFSPTMKMSPTPAAALLSQRRRPPPPPSPPPFGFYNPLARETQDRAPSCAVPKVQTRVDDGDQVELLITSASHSLQPLLHSERLSSTQPTSTRSSIEVAANVERTEVPTDFARTTTNSPNHQMPIMRQCSGDDLPGAKARKLLGIGAEGGWDEDDEDNECFDASPHQRARDRLRRSSLSSEGAGKKRFSLSISKIGRASVSSQRSSTTDCALESAPRASPSSLRYMQRQNASQTFTANSSSSSLCTSQKSHITKVVPPATCELENSLHSLPHLTFSGHQSRKVSYDGDDGLASGHSGLSRRSAEALSAASPISWVAPSSWAVSPGEPRELSGCSTASLGRRIKGQETCSAGTRMLASSAARIDAYVKKIKLHRPSVDIAHDTTDRPCGVASESSPPSPSLVSLRDQMLWEKSLERSQNDASWQTMIEHRPRHRRDSPFALSWSSVGCGASDEQCSLARQSAGAPSFWSLEFPKDMTPPYPFGPSKNLSITKNGRFELEESLEEIDERSEPIPKTIAPRSRSLGDTPLEVTKDSMSDKLIHLRGYSAVEFGPTANPINFVADQLLPLRRFRGERLPSLPPQAPLRQHHLCSLPVTPGPATQSACLVPVETAPSVGSPCPSLTQSPTLSESFAPETKEMSFLPRLSQEGPSSDTLTSDDDDQGCMQKSQFRHQSSDLEHHLASQYLPAVDRNNTATKPSRRCNASNGVSPSFAPGTEIDFKSERTAQNLDHAAEHNQNPSNCSGVDTVERNPLLIRQSDQQMIVETRHTEQSAVEDAHPENCPSPSRWNIDCISLSPFPQDEDEHLRPCSLAIEGIDESWCESGTRWSQRLEAFGEMSDLEEARLSTAGKGILCSDDGLLIILPPSATYRPDLPALKACASDGKSVCTNLSAPECVMFAASFSEHHA